MSIKQLSLAWENSRAKGGDLLVLLAMADIAQDSGYCWPGYTYLANKSRLSRRQAIRIVQNLIDLGEVYKIDSGTKKSNEYVLFVWDDGNVQLRQCSSCNTLEIPELQGYHIHHIVPKSDGGSDDQDNLTVLCPRCHDITHKGSSDIMTLGLNVTGDTHVTRVVTPMSPDTLKIRKLNKDDDYLSKLIKFYSANIYPITPLIADNIADMVEDYGYACVEEGMKNAAEGTGRSWNYVEACIRNAKTGYKPNGNGKPKSDKTDKEVQLDKLREQYPTFSDDKLEKILKAEQQYIGGV